MANKRRLEVSSPIDEQQEDEQAGITLSDRDIAIEGTWGEWFQRVFLKYCYAIAILFLACVVPLEIVRQLDGSTGIVAAFISVLIIVPLGLFAYLKLWGDNGMWGPGYPEDD